MIICTAMLEWYSIKLLHKITHNGYSKVGSMEAIISGMDSAGGSRLLLLLDGGKNKTISMD
jgi:hypothetical protein